MKKNIFYQTAVFSAAIGLLILFTVILSGKAYPHMLFRIGTPLGLLFVFASVLMLFLSWLWEIRRGLKEKQYLWVAVIVLFGLLVLARALLRIG